jgi:hypothetical protein
VLLDLIQQLLRFHGVLAPNAVLREMIAPPGPDKEDDQSERTLP